MSQLDVLIKTLEKTPNDEVLNLAIADALEEAGQPVDAAFHRIQWTTTFAAWQALLAAKPSIDTPQDAQHLEFHRSHFARRLRATMHVEAHHKKARALCLLRQAAMEQPLRVPCAVTEEALRDSLIAHEGNIAHYFPVTWQDRISDLSPKSSIRARKACNRLGVTSVWQLAGVSIDEWYTVKNCGDITVVEIGDILRRFGANFPEELDLLKGKKR